MSEKPTYEELKNRIQELEKTESKLKSSEAKLRESQQVIEGILNTIPVRVFWKDQNLVYLGCNKLFAQDAGFADPKDIVGKDDYQMGWQDQAELYRKDDRKVIDSGDSKFLIEEPQTTPEGTTITLLTSKTPLRNATGDIIGILGAYMDITDRKQAEEALKLNEQRYKSAQRIGQVGNWEYDLLTKNFWGSDEAKRIYGFDPENNKFTTDEVENCIPDRERVHQALVDLIEKGEPYNLEFEIRPITGPDKKIINSIAEVIKNESGIPTKVVGVIQDITDRRLADERLRKSEEKYRTLLTITSEGFWLINSERKTIEVNEALCKMLGYTQDEMIGKTPLDFVDDENRKLFIVQMAKIPTTGQRSYEMVLQTKKGKPLYAQFNATTIKDELGEVLGSFALITDITENKRMAEVLRESEEKYRSMMEAMEDPIYICSSDFHVEYLNPAMIRVLGHDATGESCFQAIYGLDKRCSWCVHEKIQKGERVFTEVLNPQDGHTYHVSHSPVFHADDSISKMTIYRDITKRKHLEEEREKLIQELQNALAEIKTLTGLLPICSYCKKVRDDKGYWNQIETYIHEHSEVTFSHGICQDCAKKYFPDMDLYDE